MKALLINYNYEPLWLSEYTDLEPIIYDRSDDGVERNLTQYGEVYKTKNLGDVDYDKLGFLIENYYTLPDVFLWGKTNLFKFIGEDEFKKVCRNSDFTPLLTQNHRTYADRLGQVCYYKGGMYHERNDSWYFNAGLDRSSRFNSWTDWASRFGLPMEAYIPFPPGGNYILTKERVHKWSKDLYEEMRSTLSYAKHPVEAHCCERSYLYLWR